MLPATTPRTTIELPTEPPREPRISNAALLPFVRGCRAKSMPRVIKLQNAARRRAIAARTLAIKERMCCLNRQSLGGGVG
jgi:hypothetical protein